MKKILALAILCLSSAGIHAQNTRVIAHRGFHAVEGSARNTLSSLRNAQKLGIYGSECDVNMTADDSLVVVHGDWHFTPGTSERVHVQKSDYKTVRSVACAGGNVVPTFREYLAQTAKDPDTRLVVEIKRHETPERERRVTEAVVAMVGEFGLQEQVDYISFSSFVCDELVRLAPGAEVAYINGDMTPDEAKEHGYTGIDYSRKVFRKHPEWIARAHELGLTVNAWIVDKPDDIKFLVDRGIDFITSDNPLLVMQMLGQAPPAKSLMPEFGPTEGD